MTNQPSTNPPIPFEILQNQVSDAHWRWKSWKQLFWPELSEMEERANLLNNTGSSFFVLLQQVLADSVVLILCKISDGIDSPVKGGGPRRRNLTFKAQFDDVRGSLPAGSIAQIQVLLDDFDRAMTPLRETRNRLIAHNDHKVVVGQEAVPGVLVSEVDAALHKAVAIMNLLDPEAGQRDFVYTQMITRGDASAVLGILEFGSKCMKANLANHMHPFTLPGPMPPN